MKVIVVADQTSLEKDIHNQTEYVRGLVDLLTRFSNTVIVQSPADSIDIIRERTGINGAWTEPFKRGTALSIGLGAVRMAIKHPNELVLFAFANQNIRYEEKLLSTLRVAEEMYRHLNKFLMIGVTVTEKNNLYGYIEIGKVLQEIGGIAAFEMKSFVRYPSSQELERYLTTWKYMWDTGYLIATPEQILQLYSKIVPDIYEGLMTIKAVIGKKLEREILSTVYEKFPTLSISKAIYEKINPDDFAVIPVDLGVTRLFEDA